MFKKTLVAALALSLAAAPATAGSWKGHGHPKHKGDKHRGYEYRGDKHRGYEYRDDRHRSYKHWGDEHRSYKHRGHGPYGYGKHWVPKRHRHKHKHRKHFYGGPGYRGGYIVDDRAFLWLGLTAIGLRALDVLSYPQRVVVADSTWRAAAAPIGRPVVWSEGGASGAVTAVSEGFAANGEFCREFQQEVRVGGRTERGYGTACLQEDGDWRIAH